MKYAMMMITCHVDTISAGHVRVIVDDAIQLINSTEYEGGLIMMIYEHDMTSYHISWVKLMDKIRMNGGML
jgi:hypothetical protein